MVVIKQLPLVLMQELLALYSSRSMNATAPIGRRSGGSVTDSLARHASERPWDRVALYIVRISWFEGELPFMHFSAEQNFFYSTFFQFHHQLTDSGQGIKIFRSCHFHRNFNVKFTLQKSTSWSKVIESITPVSDKESFSCVPDDTIWYSRSASVRWWTSLYPLL